MPSFQDRQRSKVYQWEVIASGNLAQVHDLISSRHHLYKPEFETLQECAAFLEPIWRAERGRYGRAKVPMPVIERPNRGQRRAIAHPDHRITLPKWTRNRWMILHEMAHLLNPGEEAHGPRFVGILMGLLARHAGYDAQELMASADEAGVKYHVRSIGAVPANTLSQRLARLLPVKEMDAAFELDVSWRQVRGAALQLVRAHLAMWKRDVLVPLPRRLEGALAL